MKPNSTYENTTSSKPLGKPTVETVWAGIPLSLELSSDSTEGRPILVDKESCGKEFKVRDGEIYTIRLGMHSNPNGLRAFTRDSMAVCTIPVTEAKGQIISAMFAAHEIYPAIFMDYVGLYADVPFSLEFMYQSAALECNDGEKGLLLSDNAISFADDMIIISHDGLKGEIPAYCNYTYDFIRVQVRVVFEQEDSNENACR